jgi:hypothetical protein
MKQFIALITLSFFAFTSYGLEPEERAPAYSHLVEINAQWQFHAMDAPIANKAFANDNERIKYHLTQVIRVLRSTEYKTSPDAYKKRMELLDALEAYAHRQVFPTNHYHSVRTPYFIDNYNVHCAVGYLMQYSGYEALARRIQKEHNYDYLADITTGGVGEWADEHGFTLDELKWIQPGYPPQLFFKAMEQGVNGHVKGMHYDESGDALFIYGDFDSVNGSPCVSAALYLNEKLQCLDMPFDHSVNDVKQIGTNHAFVGSFHPQPGDQVFCIDNGGKWKFYPRPDGKKSIGKAIAISADGKTAYLVLKVLTGKIEEVWEVNLAEAKWRLLGKAGGTINAIELNDKKLFIGGDFTSFQWAKPDSTFQNAPYNHCVEYYLDDKSWKGIGNGSPVVTMKTYKGITYFGCECSYIPGHSTGGVCLTSETGGLVNLTYNDFQIPKDTSNVRINSIEILNDSSIYIAGDFTTKPIHFSLSGENVATVHKDDQDQVFLYPLSLVDRPVNSIELIKHQLVIGGEFTWNGGRGGNGFEEVTLSHLGITRKFTSVGKPLVKDTHLLYPNPVKNELKLMGYEDIHVVYNVVDVTGKQVLAGNTRNGVITELDQLIPGQYVLNVILKSGEANYRFVKE